MEERTMKPTLLLVPALMLAGAAPAAAQSLQPFNGLYVGVTGGYENYNVKIGRQGTSGVGDILGIGNDDRSPNMEGVFYGGLVGYRMRMDNFMFGVEGTLTQSQADKTITTANGRLKLDSDLTWGASALAGFVMAERTLFYGRAGYVWNEFGSPIEVNSGNVFNRYKNDKTLGGIRVGLGAEWLLTQSISLRAEANYTFYDSYRDRNIDRRINPDGLQAGAAVIFGF
jgi:outer membrane immunogenic protein